MDPDPATLEPAKDVLEQNGISIQRAAEWMWNLHDGGLPMCPECLGDSGFVEHGIAECTECLRSYFFAVGRFDLPDRDGHRDKEWIHYLVAPRRHGSGRLIAEIDNFSWGDAWDGVLDEEWEHTPDGLYRATMRALAEAWEEAQFRKLHAHEHDLESLAKAAAKHITELTDPNGNRGSVARSRAWIRAMPLLMTTVAKRGKRNPPRGDRTYARARQQFWELLRKDPDPHSITVANDLAEEAGISLASLGESFASNEWGALEPWGEKQTRGIVSEGVFHGIGDDDVKWEIFARIPLVKDKPVGQLRIDRVEFKVSRDRIWSRVNKTAAVVNVDWENAYRAGRMGDPITVDEARDLTAKAALAIIRTMKEHPAMNAEEVVDQWWGEQDHEAFERGDLWREHRVLDDDQ